MNDMPQFSLLECHCHVLMMPCKLEAIEGTMGRANTTLIPINSWAARYGTWLLINLTSKGVVFFFFFSPVLLLLLESSLLQVFLDILSCKCSVVGPDADTLQYAAGGAHEQLPGGHCSSRRVHAHLRQRCQAPEAVPCAPADVQHRWQLRRRSLHHRHPRAKCWLLPAG